MEAHASRPLSRRQAEIAALIADGKSNREIAAMLFVSERTVENHIMGVSSKLGVHSRTQIVAAILGRAGGSKAAPAPANNLPQSLKQLIGRNKETTEIDALLRDGRLVTLTGTGGIGKTQTALYVAAQVLTRFKDGVWFVELASLANPRLVITAIARALSITESADGLALTTLTLYLQHKALLLVLDNCEHLITETAHVADTLLRSCSQLQILTTSREPLKCAGERIYTLGSLPVPCNAAAANLTTEQALTYGALALFAARARGSDAGFTLDARNVQTIASICRRLDGLPFAIELAAARLRTLSVKTLTEKLDSRFLLLTGGERTAPLRQQTLAALLDWSYELLAPGEQRLFELLSIFVGGCTLETASAAFSDESAGEFALLDRLSSLVDKSLVVISAEGPAARYSMLESTREYAREKLIVRGDLKRAAHRHATALLVLAEQLEDQWDTLPQREWSARAEPEAANWRAALSWTLEDGNDIVLGQRLASAVRCFFTNYGPAEGFRWIRVALAKVNEQTDRVVVAKLELTEALFANGIHQPRAALAPAERALQHYRSLGDPFGVAHALIAVGRALVSLNDAERAEVMLREALPIASELGNRRFLCSIIGTLGFSRLMQGDADAARAYYLEELALREATGAETDAIYVASNLAELEMMGGDASAALRYARNALARAREFTDEALLIALLENTSAYLVAAGNYEEAIELARDGFEQARQAHLEVRLVLMIQHLAAAMTLRICGRSQGSAERDSYRVSATLLGYVDARLIALDASRGPIESRERAELVAALDAVLDSDELTRLCATGDLLSEDEALAVARSI